MGVEKMKTKEIISIHDFLKLLDFYKKEIQIKYQDVVNENEHIDTVSEAIVEEKLEPVQEKIEEANIELDKEEPMVLTDLREQDPFQLRLDINDTNGNRVSIYKSNDALSTPSGVESTTHFSMQGDDDLFYQLDTNPQIKHSLSQLLSNNSIDLFFDRSYFDIDVSDEANQTNYILRFNLQKQYLLKAKESENNEIKQIEIQSIPHAYLDILTIRKQDLPNVLKRIYPKFEKMNENVLQKTKYRLNLLKKKILD